MVQRYQRGILEIWQEMFNDSKVIKIKGACIAEILLEIKKNEIKKEMQTWDAKFLEHTTDIKLRL